MAHHKGQGCHLAGEHTWEGGGGGGGPEDGEDSGVPVCVYEESRKENTSRMGGNTATV
ncbi:MAG: hypothetical protein DHS20C15_34960 [Planctomycetota bacterium]|nr:MAG: hypothetical protein DHS20C15_34960 [Planctomycetota bacterium]